ncbi:shikimate dehydrogenase [bacterium]|nr:shikimate dehydrogenase [bacterium]
MAINKELYERYKAMKQAKLAETGTSAKSSSYPTINQTSLSQQTQIPEPVQSIQYQTVANTEPEIKKFALIGYPLGHSISKYIQKAGFESMKIKATYEILETPPDKLIDRIKYLKTNGYSGFNVTIPLKLPIVMFVDELDASTYTVNAINTVKIDPQTKRLIGYNTDTTGFKNAIPKDITLCGKTAGILGTGGASRAAISALASERIKEIKLYTRNVANTLELLEYLRKTFPATEFNAYQIDRIRELSDIDILINATPIGMKGHGADYTPVEEQELQTLPKNALVYDVIYNPKKTKLIQLAQKHNYRTVNGVDMLVYQALEAQKIWTGHTPDFKDMKISALENL